MNWVFLLQRESDRYWQPIQTPILEVEECKYRIIGQTNRSNLCVEVRVNIKPFESSFEMKRNTYFRRTNSEGLIIILPYTYFFAGLWELSCCSDAMSELMGVNWRVSQQIYSIPKISYLALPNTDSNPCLEATDFNLFEPVPTHQTLPVSSSTTKVLPPKLNLSSERIARKSPELPNLPLR
ncbi:hypothetical protein C7H19_01335 [Aphanothece hegewaldii CCALA 016]|uniref:Uncharacterized protein n=1 Tax=Aphanothece hegewaldii CCALA 016 TaxID=2107694 RepID=A0A2T1M3P4_9CHRO|nr:hypothetical protein [Aphanothece hegewaldii]PSF39459.1 hypothetical protein C7H19_01335 [Aphanothece hegewaldii CCALA 016]